MLKALGEGTRLKIFKALLERKCCVRSLSRKLGISESAVSQHMKVLKSAGLVTGEKFGYHTHYMPVREAIAFMRGEFAAMEQSALSRECDGSQCRCEFRKENKARISCSSFF